MGYNYITITIHKRLKLSFSRCALPVSPCQVRSITCSGPQGDVDCATTKPSASRRASGDHHVGVEIYIVTIGYYLTYVYKYIQYI
jgi:hypothetical protein